MRKTLVLLLILVAGFTACNKDNTTSTSSEQSIAPTALPLSITNYVSENYPAETITSALKVSNASASYIVTLNTLEELAFDDNGGYLGRGEDFHHHGDSLGGFDDDSIGHLEDSLGGHHGGHHGGHGGHGGHGEHGEHGTFVSLDSLPTAISDYILANYAAYTTKHAEIDSICPFGAVYEVFVEQSGNGGLKLLFDLNGFYLAKGERAKFSDAPQAVIDYVNANFTLNHPCEKMEVITLADNTINYRIFIKSNNQKTVILLSADGTLVCEQ
jgi:hypothetical protein